MKQKLLIAASVLALSGSYALAQNAQQETKVPFTSELKLSDNLSEAQVRNVQQTLKQKGFDAGEVDGIWGENTRAALKSFQQAQNIEATGQLDRNTLIALELEGGLMDQGQTGTGDMQEKPGSQGMQGDRMRNDRMGVDGKRTE
jgi:peptidoglycan hydrolase-like protein with peptidoglycan-binding domain